MLFCHRKLSINEIKLPNALVIESILHFFPSVCWLHESEACRYKFILRNKPETGGVYHPVKFHHKVLQLTGLVPTLKLQ